ncbi:MAG: aminotransferase class I/II-fold pyridoxal phosphate-dependent enzyme [Bacillota bacterium]|nr:aminotransferase class I/II-fold pyridoxal phosphate-dependent enzyme [Bacillota bacterium]
MLNSFEKIDTLKKSSKDFRNIFEIMMDNDGAACEFQEMGQIVKWTYSDYKNKINKSAARLAKLTSEISRDSYIALKMANSPWWPIMFWAIMMAGYKPLLVDASLNEEMTAYLMKQSGAKMIISKPFELDEKEDSKFIPRWANEFALCTSGTTASSKIYYYTGEAVCYQLFSTGRLLKESKRMAPKPGDKVLAFLPLHHIFGFLASYMWYCFHGATLVYIKDRAPETILEACRKHEVTHITTVPLLPNNIAKSILRKVEQAPAGKRRLFKTMVNASIFLQRINTKLGLKAGQVMFKSALKNLMGPQVKCIISGGSHIPYETLKLINAIGYFVTSGYGMTEVGITSVETSESIGRRLSGSVGTSLDYIEYKVEDGEEVGGLLVSGKAIHSGRLINGKALPAEVDDQGWFVTGDIGRVRNGKLWIEGRIKDIIVNESGENVYPDELEDYFDGLPLHTQLSILGTQKDENYEYITLVLSIPKYDLVEENYAKLRNAIIRINGSLPVMKRINKAYLTSEPLPVVNGIKVKRIQLRKMIENKGISLVELDLKGEGYEVMEVVKKSVNIEEVHKKEFEEIKGQIRSAFSEVLHLPEDSIGDNDHFIDDLGGDSLSSISLLVKVEENFGIVIPDSEYYNCTNVNNLASLILKKSKGIKDFEDAAAAIEKVNPVTSFEKSREYQSFLLRRKAAEEIGNPYFICHDSTVRDVSRLNGEREILHFGSYNYIGMSGHPETIQAAKDAASKYGTSASGSRILAGEKHLYQELEAKIAKWKHAEDAIVLVGGHSTNVTFVGNFCSEKDIILYDALSHNSVAQGCQLSKSDAKAFPHNDFVALESILKNVRPRYEKILVIVEGVYSMDGDIAPIPEFVKLKKKYGFFLMVDEAHSACVIGEHGGGVDEYFGLDPYDIDIKMGTLSKGLGTCGGYLAGRKTLIEYLKYNVPGFVFSVGINTPSAAATLSALEILERDNSPVQRLHKNIEVFMREAHKRGLDTCLAGETAIIPIMVGEDEDAFLISNVMLERGIFVPPAVYPAVPRGQARLRFCVISEHKEEQIIRTLDTLMEIAKEHRIDLSKKEEEEEVV